MTAGILVVTISAIVASASPPKAAAYPAGAGSLVDAQAISSKREVREAWSAALSQEAYGAEWAPEWKHPVTRASVAESLSKSLAVLRGAGQANVEALLAAGLAARWAHNVDVDGAFEAGVSALEKGLLLAPRDPRPEWFLGTSLCQTPEQMVEGMGHLLEVERRAAGTPLPALFWREYVDCADRTSMQAHAFRAQQTLVRNGWASEYEKRQLSERRKLVKRAAASDEIAQADAWKAKKGAGSVSFSSVPCGFRFEIAGDLMVDLPPASKGACSARVDLPELAGRKGSAVAFVARMRRGDETLASFVEAATEHLERRPSARTACPVASCMSFEVVNPKWHEKEGGGAMIAVAFERPEPEFPGIAMEQLQQLPGEAGKMTYYLPQTQLARYPGTLFYMVFLDSALPVSSESRSYYERLVKTLVVE